MSSEVLNHRKILFHFVQFTFLRVTSCFNAVCSHPSESRVTQQLLQTDGTLSGAQGGFLFLCETAESYEERSEDGKLRAA